jgi:hypothetical protein
MIASMMERKKHLSFNGIYREFSRERKSFNNWGILFLPAKGVTWHIFNKGQVEVGLLLRQHGTEDGS